MNGIRRPDTRYVRMTGAPSESQTKRLRRFGHRMPGQDAVLMRTVWQGHTGGEGDGMNEVR